MSGTTDANTFAPVGDSGCTHDVFNEPEHFHTMNELKKPIRMDVGCKGMYITVTHIGDAPVMVRMPNGEERKHAFENAFYSKECSGNFVSNSLRDELGWTVVSKNEEMHHYDANNNLMFHATLKDGLCHVNCRSSAIACPVRNLKTLRKVRRRSHHNNCACAKGRRSCSPEPHEHNAMEKQKGSPSSTRKSAHSSIVAHPKNARKTQDRLGRRIKPKALRVVSKSEINKRNSNMPKQHTLVKLVACLMNSKLH